MSSMTRAMEGTRDWLISQSGIKWGTGAALPLNKDNCFLAHMAIPQKITGQFAICIDDAGVESGNMNNFYDREMYSINIGIWRRVGRVPKDRMAQQMIIDNEIYSSLAQTLADNERELKMALHCNTEVPVWLNSKYALPDEDEFLDRFIQYWVYRGRSGNEVHVIDDSGHRIFGRVMKFDGLTVIKESMQLYRKAAL